MREHRTLFVSTHAKAQAASRGVPPSTFWDAGREASRTGLKNNMVLQHQKLLPILTDTKVLLRIGDRLFKVSKTEITTRLILNGITFAIGIRKRGDDYTPLTCVTAWS